MSLRDVISQGLQPFQNFRDIDNGVSLSTHCLYPNNSSVQVFVRGEGKTYFVTDDGGAMRDVQSSGVIFGASDAKYQRLVQRQGLVMRKGVIATEAIGIEMVPAAILLVANASKEVAEAICNTWRTAKARNFKELVRDLLLREFPNMAIKEDKLFGDSHKQYKFDNVLHLPTGRRVVVDAVLRDSNSMNARVVANLDVRHARHEGVDQRIVYDDSADWPASDLSLLDVSQVGVIAFSRMPQALVRCWRPSCCEDRKFKTSFFLPKTRPARHLTNR